MGEPDMAPCAVCGKMNLRTNAVCWSCKIASPGTAPSFPELERKLRREITIFLCGFGAILGILGFVLFADRPGVGAFVFACAAGHLLCGILLTATGRNVFAVVGSIVGGIFGLAGVAVTLPLFFAGRNPIGMIVLIVCGPALLAYRTSMLLRMARQVRNP